MADEACNGQGHTERCARLGDVLELAYRRLAKSRRSEYFYKNQIISHAVARGSSSRLSVFSEFRVGGCRADLLLVRGSAQIFEIKSEYDDFSKASKQVAAYYSAFKIVSFVIHQSHLDSAMEALPADCGIFTVTPRAALRAIRAPRETSSQLSSQAIFDCLLGAEQDELLATSGISNSWSYEECLSSVAELPIERLYSFFVKKLSMRNKRRVFQRGMDVPPYLAAAAHSYQLRISDWERLLSILDTTVSSHI
ncbi:sce7726 family protein [Xanthomonas sacchari]|uniref:sce7726 family protein n=1 Tax=Xanthomonas sacchari TaxID=56458 RepID=UPI0022502DFF|nr:sce7726 family protein [Xanthomonas sacchari]